MKAHNNFWDEYLINNTILMDLCKELKKIQAIILAAYKTLHGHVRIQNIPNREYSLAELIDEFIANLCISKERDIEYQNVIETFEKFENDNLMPTSVIKA